LLHSSSAIIFLLYAPSPALVKLGNSLLHSGPVEKGEVWSSGGWDELADVWLGGEQHWLWLSFGQAVRPGLGDRPGGLLDEWPFGWLLDRFMVFTTAPALAPAPAPAPAPAKNFHRENQKGAGNYW